MDDETLRLLFSSPYPWTVAELDRELGNSDARDGIGRLPAPGSFAGSRISRSRRELRAGRGS